MADSSMSYEPEEEEESDHETSDDESSQHIDFTEACKPLSPSLQNSGQGSHYYNGAITGQSTPARRNRRRAKSRSQALRAAATLPISAYSQIYQETVNDILRGFDNAVPSRLSHSQYGIINWTVREKDIFFSALARKGKDSIAEISALISTKSQMEVRHYLDLLQRSFALHHATGFVEKPIALSDIPAAYEISTECCAALERVADALSLRDEQAQNVAGRRRHGDLWLVDREVATYIDSEMVQALEVKPGPDVEDSQITDQETELSPKPESQPRITSTAKTHSIFATGKLLKLSNWIQLSEHIFMNSGSPKTENNWQNLCLENETPALTCDAFSEFYALTISITQRLIQSSQFFAMSRHRAVGRSGVIPRSLVKKEDVFAALDVLGMKRNARSFWVGASRRCLLDVRHRITHNGESALTYDEVEELLDTPSKVDTSFQSTKSLRKGSSEISTHSFDDCSDGSHNASDENTSTEVDSSAESDESLSDPEEKEAEELDQQASREEEARLWRVITKSVTQMSTTGMKSESGLENEDGSQKPRGKRKTRQETANWRDTTLYQAEWETFGLDTVDVDKEMNFTGRIKRPRVS